MWQSVGACGQVGAGALKCLCVKSRMLMSALSERLSPAGLEAQVVGEPPLFDVVFASGNIHRYRDPLRVDAARMAQFNAQLRGRGILRQQILLVDVTH